MVMIQQVPHLANDLVVDLSDTDIGRWAAEAIGVQDGRKVFFNAQNLKGKEIIKLCEY